MQDFMLMNVAMKFKCESKNSFVKDSSLATTCYLCRDLFHDLTYELEIADSNNELLKSSELPSAFKEHRERILEIKRSIIGKPFKDILQYFMYKMDISVQALAIDADIDERTIRRYLDGTSINTEKRSIIVVCMALKLSPNITEMVLNQARISLVQGDKDDEALLSIIACMRGKKSMII